LQEKKILYKKGVGVFRKFNTEQLLWSACGHPLKIVTQDSRYIYKTIIFACISVWAWSPILREEHRLRVFENKVLRRIFGLRRDEVMGGWRKLRNEELFDLYS
jgi:hypothetical protein